MTSLKIIIGKDKVFGTYLKTICFSQAFSNEEEKKEAINNAKIVIYDYAESFGSVYLRTVHNEKLNSNEEVFEFLEKTQ